MAEVRPLKALHYNLPAIPSLADVTAPPYDVIDPAQRAELLARSPLNVVEIDLPQAPAGRDPYDHAAETLEAWTLQGVLVADREPAIWALTQSYTGPDGERRTRSGILARMRVTDYGPGLVRPHERTQPGPKEDRLRLTEATRHRVWRIPDPSVHEAVRAGLAEAELLIADGHHRYETARAYAEEIGGEGPHRYTLVCLASLEDPGLTILGTHRMLRDPGPEGRERIARAIREQFEVEEAPRSSLDPAGSDGVGVFGYVDAGSRDGLRLRLKDPAGVNRALAGRSPAYRRLDAAILEEV